MESLLSTGMNVGCRNRITWIIVWQLGRMSSQGLGAGLCHEVRTSWSVRALVHLGYCSTGRAVELQGGPLGLSGVIAAVLQAAVIGLHGGFIDAMLCWVRTEERWLVHREPCK